MTIPLGRVMVTRKMLLRFNYTFGYTFYLCNRVTPDHPPTSSSRSKWSVILCDFSKISLFSHPGYVLFCLATFSCGPLSGLLETYQASTSFTASAEILFLLEKLFATTLLTNRQIIFYLNLSIEYDMYFLFEVYLISRYTFFNLVCLWSSFTVFSKNLKS